MTWRVTSAWLGRLNAKARQAARCSRSVMVPHDGRGRSLAHDLLVASEPHHRRAIRCSPTAYPPISLCSTGTLMPKPVTPASSAAAASVL